MELYICIYIFTYISFECGFFFSFHFIYSLLLFGFGMCSFCFVAFVSFVFCIVKASMLSPLQTVPLKLIAGSSIHSPVESDALHNFIFYASIESIFYNHLAMQRWKQRHRHYNYILHECRVCVCMMHNTQNHHILYRFFHFKRIILCTSFQYH